uniref:hypothetical protein n=1 Tax=Trichocoleus desertorum TaxID=1481672 RepID=UPI0025B5F2AA|nr:hypothetical protein [Trichocoleus desertorum]
MTVNKSARFVRLLVGDELLDYSSACAAVQLSDSQYEPGSGLSTTSGTITLIPVRDLPGSLDDRKNPTTWKIGQKLTLYTTKLDGSFAKHPRAALRILSAEYSDETKRLTLKVGCLLAALNFKQPTDPKKAEIEPGKATNRAAIASKLLTEAGITQIANIGVAGGYPINYPIRVSGGYLETVGKLLYAAGCIGWIDKDEKFQVKQVSIKPLTSVVTVTVGANELWYRRLTNPEGPREIVKVNGVSQVARLTKTIKNLFTEKIGNGIVLGEFWQGATIILLQSYLTEEWDETRKILTTTTISYQPRGLILPNQADPIKAGLILSEKRIEKRYFERTEEGKLLKIVTEVQRPKGAVLGEYYEANDLTDSPAIAASFFAETTEVVYQYDRKNRTQQITTTKFESMGAILTGTGEDWAGQVEPTKPYASESQVEAWRLLRHRNWEHTIEIYKPLVKVRSLETLPEDATQQQKLALTRDDQNSIREVSGSGQTTPPAVEHCPAKATFEDRQVSGSARFGQYGGNTFRERERSFSVDYLQGYEADEDDLYTYRFTFAGAGTDGSGINNGGGDEGGGGAQAQCQMLAQQEGAILIGKHKGQEIGIALRDELFDNWSPLMAADVLEQDGTVRTYLLDGSNWVLYEREALVNFDGIWVGDRITTTINGSTTPTTTLKLPYLEVDVCEAGWAIGAQITDYPYSLDAGADVIQAGLGIGAQITETETLVETDLVRAGLGIGAQTTETLPPSDTVQAGLGIGARILDNENDIIQAGLAAGVRVTDEAIADELHAGIGIGARVRDGQVAWQDLTFSDWQNLSLEDWQSLEF